MGWACGSQVYPIEEFTILLRLKWEGEKSTLRVSVHPSSSPRRVPSLLVYTQLFSVLISYDAHDACLLGAAAAIRLVLP